MRKSMTIRLQDTQAMVIRTMKHTTRQIDILIITAILPLMQLLMLIFILGGAMNTGDIKYIDYILPGILLMGIGSCTSMAAVSVKEDMAKGIMDRFRSMDISHSAFLNGHMTSTLMRSAITAFVLLSVAVLIGFRTQMSISSYGLVFLILFLYALAYTWGSILWGLVCPSLESASVITYLGMLLPYVSSCFVPIETMTPIVQTVARYQPFTPLAESIRGLFLGVDTGNHIIVAICWCLAIFILSYTSAIRIYNKRRKM